MNGFIEKWNSDSRYRTKIKLSLYTLFVVIVAIFAISNRNNIQSDDLVNEYNNIDTNENDEAAIEIPQKYSYVINITINEDDYQYTGTKDSEKETITKVCGDITTNYIYQDDNYYKDESGTYILTTKDEVYDKINYDYIKLENINQYLLKATEENDQYLVYLKDIILASDSEEYITIKLEQNNINVDYTALMKNFDKTIEKYLIEVNIEELE